MGKLSWDKKPGSFPSVEGIVLQFRYANSRHGSNKLSNENLTREQHIRIGPYLRDVIGPKVQEPFFTRYEFSPSSRTFSLRLSYLKEKSTQKKKSQIRWEPKWRTLLPTIYNLYNNNHFRFFFIIG